jgi:hypothetical protein
MSSRGPQCGQISCRSASHDGMPAGLAMMFRLAWLVVVARNAACRASDKWLDLKCATAAWYSWRIAPADVLDRARMHGEVFRLTGNFLAGWPYRYMAEFTDGEDPTAGTRPS